MAQESDIRRSQEYQSFRSTVAKRKVKLLFRCILENNVVLFTIENYITIS